MTGEIVQTTYGALRGEVDRGVHVFRGIRYGASTEGERRFKAPARPKAWEGIRDAVAFGPATPQAGVVIDPVTADRPNPEPTPQGEDCLVLNVWTPQPGDGKKRPVMVWLHGGGFRSGVGSASVSNGVNLAKQGDVVMVSLNHRLNVFGHLYLEDVAGPEFRGSGLAGTLDIVLALEWIRDNIAAFGGDPGNVTLFGVSGGGRKICMLLGMPVARGLFHRGIIQSGAHPRGVPREQASRFASLFLDYVGIKPADIHRLQEMPFDDVTKLMGEFVSPRRNGAAGLDRMTLSPVVDGVDLPADPFGSVASPLAADVPIIIGNTRHEMGTYLARVPGMDQIEMPAVMETVRPVLGARTDEVVELYQRNRPGATPYDILVALTTEDRRMLSTRLAEAKIAGGTAPVYMYQFAWETDVANGLVRAGHGLDVPFTFNNVSARPTTGTRADRFDMGEIMSETWIAFARNGVPDGPRTPHWPAYDTGRRATLRLDVPPSIVDDPAGDERRAWDGIPINLPFEGPAFVGAWSAE